MMINQSINQSTKKQHHNMHKIVVIPSIAYQDQHTQLLLWNRPFLQWLVGCGLGLHLVAVSAKSCLQLIRHFKYRLTYLPALQEYMIVDGDDLRQQRSCIMMYSTSSDRVLMVLCIIVQFVQRAVLWLVVPGGRLLPVLAVQQEQTSFWWTDDRVRITLFYGQLWMWFVLIQQQILLFF